MIQKTTGGFTMNPAGPFIGKISCMDQKLTIPRLVAAGSLKAVG